MKTSCIRHPGNERINIYRQWQLQACSGSIPAAVLLSYFEDVHNSQYAGYEHDGIIPPEIMVQWHSKEKIGQETGLKHRDIAKAIAKLKELGFLTVGKTPNGIHFPFRLNVDAINSWLAISVEEYVK